jgi:uncharacterized repeat protein (TIGR01451 family)
MGWCLIAALLVGAATDIRAQTPAGTVISSTAQATFQDVDGTSFTILSNPALVVVGQVAGVDLSPPRVSTADPGNVVVFTHTLQNIGNGSDSFTVVTRSSTGWPVTVHRDANGNGALDPGESAVVGPVALAMGASTALLVAVNVPGLATVRGLTDTIAVVATSRFNPSVADSLEDQAQVRSVGIAVTLDKSVDRATATPGDVLTYTITYAASGGATASNLRVSDVIPVGTSYIAGTLRLNGIPLSDIAGDDAGTFEAAGNRVVVTLATVSGGDTGNVAFQVRVSP